MTVKNTSIKKIIFSGKYEHLSLSSDKTKVHYLCMSEFVIAVNSDK